MRVFVKNLNKEVELPDTCISGGEGDVYIKDNYAFKIYHDENKAITEQKFQELNKLTKDNIIKPESLLLNNKGKIIGYMMKAIPKCVSLSRLVTNDFRTQYNITNDQILNIIQQLRETFEFIHQKNCLVVDGNEMNYLVSEDFSTVYFIDVDSYQTETSSANAYSVSTLDPLITKSKKFTTSSDWFIFSIIACTLLVGIHPFKGAYKGLSLNIKKGDVTSRMENKKSIFNKSVSVNSAVRDFSIIPNHYKEWFINLFEFGARSAAPKNVYDTKSSYDTIIKNVIFNDRIKSTLIFEMKDKINDFYLSDKYSFIKLNKDFYDIKNKKGYKVKSVYTLLFENNNKMYLVKVDKTISLLDITDGSIIYTDIMADSILVINNRLYGVFNNKLNELQLFSNKVFIKNSWDIITKNIEVFDNLIIQKISNKNVAYIPFDESCCSINIIKELNDKKVVNASIKNKMMEAIYYDNGIYKRLLIKFNASYKEYKVLLDEETDQININSTCLNNGVYISIMNDEELAITANTYDKDTINIVKDKNININSKLKSYKNDVYLINENKLELISIK